MKRAKFRIPIMTVQDTFIDLTQRNPQFKLIKKKLQQLVKEQEGNWGTAGELKYEFTFELENQWYPILETYNQWIAAALIKLIPRKMP